MPSSTAQAEEQQFPWLLSQARLDLLAAVLHKAGIVFSEVDPYCLAAERVGCLLTDLREGCQQAGAHDPFPELPLFPRFDEQEVRHG